MGLVEWTLCCATGMAAVCTALEYWDVRHEPMARAAPRRWNMGKKAIDMNQVLRDASSRIPKKYLYVLLVLDPADAEFAAHANMKDQDVFQFLQSTLDVMKSQPSEDPEAEEPQADVTREIDLGVDKDE